jgi:hypothetical protein
MAIPEIETEQSCKHTLATSM